MLHPKVKFAAIASALYALLTALEPLLGPSLPAWAASASTALVGLLAGFAAPTSPVDVPVSDGPQDVAA